MPKLIVTTRSGETREVEAAAGLTVMEADDLLDSSDDRDATSRLSCQIPFTEQLDGLRVRIAEED